MAEEKKIDKETPDSSSSFSHPPLTRYTPTLMSLYRTYRPQTFADVVGQEPIVTTLENAVAQGKISHAYLFSGSRGTGKTSIARILAKHLLVQGVTDETVKRHIGEGVAEGSIIDLIEIDAASNTGVDNIRDLIEKVQFSPVAAGAKVYIIDEVHMLSKGAFNALLKTLEEPPAYAYFILCTTELHKIPATIQSRCQRFTFRFIRDEDIIRRLQFIADQEKIPIDRLALRAIARHAQGGMRDAISLLDQVRSLEKISLEDVQQRIGETGQEFVELLFVAWEKADRKDILALVQRLEETATPLDTFVRQVLGEARVRLHAAIASNEPIDHLTTLLDALLRTVRDMRIAPVPALVLEAALLSLCIDDASTKKESRHAKKQKVEESAQVESTKLEQAKKEAITEVAQEAKEHVTKGAIIEAPDLTMQTMIAVWPDIVSKATPPALKQSLKNGRVTGVSEKGVTIAFASKFHRDRVAQNEANHLIEHLLAEHFKRQIRIECTTEEEKNATPITDSALVNLADAVSEIF